MLQKNNSSRRGGGMPQLRSRHFSNLKKCKRQNFWEVVAVGIFVRVLLQQLGGANDPILAGLMLMHWLMNCCIECALLWCTAPLMRWMPPLWCTQLMQRTLSADPTFNWAAQAHLKAAKQSSSYWLFPETLMATCQPHWLFVVYDTNGGF